MNVEQELTKMLSDELSKNIDKTITDMILTDGYVFLCDVCHSKVDTNSKCCGQTNGYWMDYPQYLLISRNKKINEIIDENEEDCL